jgi:cell division protein FtsL
MATVRAPQRASAAPRPGADRPERQAPARPPLHVVETPTRRKANIAALTVMGVAALFALLFGLVLFQTLLVQNQQRLDRIDAQVRDEQARYQRQRLQVAQLSSPARIVDEATKRLGLVPPPGTTYLAPPAASSDGSANASGSNSASSSGAAGTDPMSSWSEVKPELGEAR